MSNPERCGGVTGEPVKKRQLKQSVLREEQNLSLTAESDPSFPLESLEHSLQDDLYLPQVLERTGYVFPRCVQYLVGPHPRKARLG